MKKHFDIVIFGGLGDLCIRKLLPALYRSEMKSRFSNDSRIILVSNSEVSDNKVAEVVLKGLKSYLHEGECEPDCWEKFRARLHYVCVDLAKHDGRWGRLNDHLDPYPDNTRVYYLAIPPSLYGNTCAHLSAQQLITPRTRLVLEKPIGYDHKSANVINAQVAEFFEEENIYRIDHYLGKETVQNLLALRFGNALFEPLWDSKTIDHVQITIAESVGLEGRHTFYNKAGALRDMVQNHLLQLLCLVALEPPNKLDADNIRAEKLKVLKSLRRIDGTNVQSDTVRGQYTAGVVKGEPVPGYLDELGEKSATETYVAIKAHIDNWRWSGVPFYLRTGKRLERRFAEIVIQYAAVSHRVFDQSAGPMAPNRLVIRLQPDEGIQLTLMAKELNRQGMRLLPATLNLNFSDTFDSASSDAYQRLLLDVVDGNPSLFTHRDEVEQAWAWIDPILDAWEQQDIEPQSYEAGSWGPEAAVQLHDGAGGPWFG